VVKIFRVCLRLSLLLLSACSIKMLAPRHEFKAYERPAAPDYSQAANWAALPTTRDSADIVPYKSALHSEQATAVADVFFIHRTTFIRRKNWNATPDHAVERSSIRHQASVFNAAGRIYAPRYRQATLYSFFDEEDKNGEEAIAFAYADVKAAFEYYLKHYNHGRPIILAGHSQGTVHATRLLHDFFENDPQLRRQFVAAYLVGFPTKADEFTTIKPCPDSLATGCFVTWNAVSAGHEYVPYAHSVVTNPLTWTLDTLCAPASLNRGSVGWPFKKLDQHLTGAQVHNGLLWITPPGKPSYMRFFLPGKPEFRHSFHLIDYGMFYVNVRENAQARVRAWQLLQR
jgi:pimeloyl-ACP methyl ester carboxylesterase